MSLPTETTEFIPQLLSKREKIIYYFQEEHEKALYLLKINSNRIIYK
jgi:hypothetical protein